MGDLRLSRGWYLYVGSAFGPGGVAARCDHHRRLATRPHWHIDYLRTGLPLREIWFTHDPQHREHQWAALLASAWALASPFEGFGASDCDCRSHLFHSAVKPDAAEFRALVRRELVGHAALYCEIV
jgi:Uri superfamily endonuclease